MRARTPSRSGCSCFSLSCFFFCEFSGLCRDVDVSERNHSSSVRITSFGAAFGANRLEYARSTAAGNNDMRGGVSLSVGVYPASTDTNHTHARHGIGGRSRTRAQLQQTNIKLHELCACAHEPSKTHVCPFVDYTLSPSFSLFCCCYISPYPGIIAKRMHVRKRPTEDDSLVRSLHAWQRHAIHSSKDSNAPLIFVRGEHVPEFSRAVRRWRWRLLRCVSGAFRFAAHETHENPRKRNRTHIVLSAHRNVGVWTRNMMMMRSRRSQCANVRCRSSVVRPPCVRSCVRACVGIVDRAVRES